MILLYSEERASEAAGATMSGLFGKHDATLKLGKFHLYAMHRFREASVIALGVSEPFSPGSLPELDI